MPLDPNIILQAKSQFDPMESMQRAMTLKQLANQTQMQDQEMAQKQAMNDAIKSSIGPDGKPDHVAVFNKLIQSGMGQQAMAYKQQVQSQALDKFKSDHEASSMLFGGATPENWADKKAQAIKIGVDHADQLPDKPDAEFIKNFNNGLLSAKDKLDAALKNSEITKNYATASAATTGKQETRVAKLSDALKKDMDPDASRTGNFGKISAKVLQAENLDTLVNQYPDKNLNSRQIEELSLGLANMLSGSGGAARAQVEGLIPHSWTGKAANVKEWLMSEPYGAGQQEFVKQMMETVQREKDTANNQLNRIREQRLPYHAELMKLDPEGFAAKIQGYKMNAGDYDKRGLRIKPLPGQPPAIPSDVEKLSDSDLEALYKAHGGK